MGVLASGVLSGKFSGEAPTVTGTRVDRASLSSRDHDVAGAAVQVANELGATPAQVAIAWTLQQSPRMHPILGARNVEQLVDNLGATNVHLPPEADAQLKAATYFDVGFPTSFIEQTQEFVYGPAGSLVDGRA